MKFEFESRTKERLKKITLTLKIITVLAIIFSGFLFIDMLFESCTEQENKRMEQIKINTKRIEIIEEIITDYGKIRYLKFDGTPCLQIAGSISCDWNVAK